MEKLMDSLRLVLNAARQHYRDEQWWRPVSGPAYFESNLKAAENRTKLGEAIDKLEKQLLEIAKNLEKPRACSCEGSCPCCFTGEVENHKCNNCKREFCNVCHGIKSGNSHHNVLACNCDKPKKLVVDQGRVYEEILPGIQLHRRDLEDTHDCDI